MPHKLKSNTHSDPLASLDSVPWANLRHAYGPASDVPDDLTALLSLETATHKEALQELYSSLCHQGSRYEASAYIVPCLLAMIIDPQTPQRHDLILFLASLATGSEQIFDGDMGSVRPDLANPITTNTDLHRNFTADRFPGPYDRCTYEAVRIGIPIICALLDDPSPEVRAAAVYALSWFRTDSALILPAVLQLLHTESNEDVLSNTIIATSCLGDSTAVNEILPLLSDGRELVRWATAAGLARLSVNSCAVIHELQSCLETPVSVGPVGIMYRYGDIEELSRDSLARLQRMAQSHSSNQEYFLKPSKTTLLM